MLNGRFPNSSTAYIRQRRAELAALRTAKKWQQAIKASLKSFCTWMAAGLGHTTYEPSQCVASPDDVVDWLLSREGGGETPVHHEECLDRVAKPTCPCPRRMAHKSLVNLASSLKSGLLKLGLTSPYDSRSGLGNPADALTVTEFCATVGEEQVIAGVHPRKQNPMFIHQLEAIVSLLLEDASTGDPLAQYIAKRDLAFFTADFAAWSRGGDLAKLRKSRFQYDVRHDVAVGNLLDNKTRKAPSAIEHRIIIVGTTSEVSATAHLCNLRQAERLCLPQLESDWMFPYVNPVTGAVDSLNHVTARQMTARLNRLADRALIRSPDGRDWSMHSLRVAGAMDAYARGAPLEDICTVGGWATQAVAKSYAQMATQHAAIVRLHSLSNTVSEETRRVQSATDALYALMG